MVLDQQQCSEAGPEEMNSSQPDTMGRLQVEIARANSHAAQKPATPAEEEILMQAILPNFRPTRTGPIPVAAELAVRGACPGRGLARPGYELGSGGSNPRHSPGRQPAAPAAPTLDYAGDRRDALAAASRQRQLQDLQYGELRAQVNVERTRVGELNEQKAQLRREVQQERRCRGEAEASAQRWCREADDLNRRIAAVRREWSAAELDLAARQAAAREAQDELRHEQRLHAKSREDSLRCREEESSERALAAEEVCEYRSLLQEFRAERESWASHRQSLEDEVVRLRGWAPASASKATVRVLLPEGEARAIDAGAEAAAACMPGAGRGTLADGHEAALVGNQMALEGSSCPGACLASAGTAAPALAPDPRLHARSDTPLREPAQSALPILLAHANEPRLTKSCTSASVASVSTGDPQTRTPRTAESSAAESHLLIEDLARQLAEVVRGSDAAVEACRLEVAELRRENFELRVQATTCGTGHGHGVRLPDAWGPPPWPVPGLDAFEVVRRRCEQEQLAQATMAEDAARWRCEVGVLHEEARARNEEAAASRAQASKAAELAAQSAGLHDADGSCTAERASVHRP